MMKALAIASVVAATLLVNCAHQPQPVAKLVSLASQDGTRIASVVPTAVPYTQAGPSATAWLSNSGAHLTDGRIVSGIMIRSWSEGAAARVQVYGMATRPGAAAAFTTDESQLEPVELGSYLLRPNDRVQIAEMTSLGVEPLVLRY